ncbi:hypothetical protein Ciccas_010714, partial [Cichlidogyrus casuarinus]
FTFEKFLAYILNQWPYFLGYGCITGGLLAVFPETISWSVIVLSLGYPILVVGALTVPWDPSKLKPAAPYLPTAVLRIPLLFSTYPALYASSLIMNFCDKMFRRLASRRRFPTTRSSKRYFQEPSFQQTNTDSLNSTRTGSIFSAFNSGR